MATGQGTLSKTGILFLDLCTEVPSEDKEDRKAVS